MNPADDDPSEGDAAVDVDAQSPDPTVMAAARPVWWQPLARELRATAERAATHQQREFSQRFRQAAESLRSGARALEHAPASASLLEWAAARIEGGADRLADNDFHDLIDTVARAARRRPAAALITGAAAGFLMIRFLKSTTPQGRG